jgi:hypothetical protein
VATADEQALARVLAPAIAQQMRSRSSASRQQQRSSGAALSASAANYAAVCMAARAASTLIQAARDHLQRQVAELAALAADIREDEAAAAADRARDGRPLTQQRPQGGTGEGAAPGLPDAQQGEEAERAGGGGSVEDDLSPEDEEHIQVCPTVVTSLTVVYSLLSPKVESFTLSIFHSACHCAMFPSPTAAPHRTGGGPARRRGWRLPRPAAGSRGQRRARRPAAVDAGCDQVGALQKNMCNSTCCCLQHGTLLGLRAD